MEYTTRSYPRFSPCGLNCGLCPRYYTVGKSRCPGCAGAGFSAVHPTCGILSCCQRKDIEYCFQCDEYPCFTFNLVEYPYDSFITHRNQFDDISKARAQGIEAYTTELDEKIIILEHLLAHFDDGRRKSYYCLAVNLINLDDLRMVMSHLDRSFNSNDDIKARAATAVSMFEEVADTNGLTLRLNKKPKG